jgi:hypothetical protein
MLRRRLSTGFFRTQAYQSSNRQSRADRRRGRWS